MKRFFNTAISLFVLFTFSCTSTGVTPKAQPQAQPQAQLQIPVSPYFTGDGGRDKSLAILIPTGNSLSGEQANILPTIVQGVLVEDMTKFSSIKVLDRQNLEKVLRETESGIYRNDEDFIKLGEIADVGYAMTGNITRTGSGYTLNVRITDTKTAVTKTAYNGVCTVEELENHTGIKKASLALLRGMDIRLTNMAVQELTEAATTGQADGQKALAQGINAQRQGTEVAALSYYYQAAVYDPSLLEAVNRSSILNANISSGNIGDDVRNDIQWRNDWVARLTETEQLFNNLNKTQSMPYTLFYVSDDIKQGTINYNNNTVTLSIETHLHGNGGWTLPIERTLQSVYDGLDATTRKRTWGLDNWPNRGVTNLNAFASRSNNFSVAFELLNDKDKVIGRQTLQEGGSWQLSGGRPSISVSADIRMTLNFQNVSANDITDRMTIRVATINGVEAETAARNGVLQIKPITKSTFDRYDNYRFSKGELQGFTNKVLNELRERNRDISLTIPNEIWGEPVISIGREAFRNIGVTVLTISNNVNSIGDGAFRDNKLTSVTIPNSVTSIGEEAFLFHNSGGGSNYRISRVTIGNNVSMAESAFQYSYNYYSGQYHFEGTDNSFGNYYNQHGKIAGIYSRLNYSTWVYDAPGDITNFQEAVKKRENDSFLYTLLLGGVALAGVIYLIFKLKAPKDEQPEY